MARYCCDSRRAYGCMVVRAKRLDGYRKELEAEVVWELWMGESWIVR